MQITRGQLVWLSVTIRVGAGTCEVWDSPCRRVSPLALKWHNMKQRRPWSRLRSSGPRCSPGVTDEGWASPGVTDEGRAFCCTFCELRQLELLSPVQEAASSAFLTLIVFLYFGTYLHVTYCAVLDLKKWAQLFFGQGNTILVFLKRLCIIHFGDDLCE